MNNSDFLSDAVALDLGKSGVKVAETLEIEVGAEWWRLINAADVTNSRVYTKRGLPSPIISGGEIHLEEHVTPIASSGQVYNFPTSTIQPFTGMAFVGEEMDLYYFTVYYRRTDNAYLIANIFNENGNHIHTIQQYGTSSSFTAYSAYWDNVNQRLMCIIFYPSSTIYILYASIAATAFSRTSSSTVSSFNTLGYTNPRVFPEQPNSIYTLFKQNGALLVKRVDPTLGQTPQSVGTAVCQTSGAVTLTVASNYNFAEKEADLFYSRTFQSVGVAWVDAGTRFIYYALESENWGTAHLISQETAKPHTYMTSFGNMVLSKELAEGGEYYIAGLRKQENSNITRPVGYTFPVNFSVLSVCAGTNTDFRLIGSVGPNLYMYTVRYSDMAITKTPSSPAAISFTPEVPAANANWSYELVKVGESGDRELYFFQIYGVARTKKDERAAVLLCYDKNIGEIVWTWLDWLSSTLFPHTYKNPGNIWWNWRQQILQRVGMHIGAIQGWTGTDSAIHFEYYWIAIASLLACNSSAEVSACFVNRTLQDVSPLQPNPTQSIAFRPQYSANTSITWDIVDNKYCFLLHQSSIHRLFFVDLNTMKFVSTTDRITIADGVGIRPSMGASVYIPAERRYSFNFTGANPSADSYVRFSRNTALFLYVNQLNSIIATTTHPDGGPAWIISLNMADVSYQPSAAANTIYLSGGSILNTSTQRRLTMPHTAYKYMVSEFEDTMLFLGQITGGDIPYTRLKCFEADAIDALAIDASDYTKTYTVDKGFSAIGGIHTVLYQGSYILYRDATARMWGVSTGAALSEYMGGSEGGAGGETGGDSAYAYEYANRTFTPYPFAREGIRAELSNISKTTKITLPETRTNLIRGLLASGTDFRGSRCILRRIFPDHADTTGSDIVLLDGYIQDWSYVPGKKGIAFTVSKTLIDVGAQFPKRLMNMGCSHVFKGARCKYLGETGRCLKTKAFCQFLNNQNQFGGFPWVAARQRRVMWR